MNSPSEALAIAGASGLFGSLFFFTPLWAPQVVFRKLIPKQPTPDESTIPAFFISDGFVVIGFLAIGNASITQLRRELPQHYLIGFAVVVNVLIVSIWLKCLRWMRTYRLVRQGPRMLVQVLLYPASVVTAGETLMSVVLLLSGLEAFKVGLVEGMNRYIGNPLMSAAFVILAGSIVAILSLRYLFKRFIVNSLQEVTKPMQ
jgi:hypothetical protein